MKFTTLGHASVWIESASGRSLLIDPYAPKGLGGRFDLPAIEVRADWVVCSHEHEDHCAIQGLPGDPERVESGEFGPFRVERFDVAHDEYDGARFGGRCDVLKVEVDGIVVVHLSDVGESPTALVDQLGDVDLLFVPVGGFFTIGALQALEWIRAVGAEHVIAIHAADTRIDLPLSSVGFYNRHRAKKIDRDLNSP